MIAAIEAPNGATLRFIDEGESVGVVEKTRASASYTEFMRRSGATPLELFLELADPSIPIPAALEGDHLAYVDREPRPIELPDELLMEPDPMAADNCDLGSNFAGYDSFCADWIAAYGYNNEHCFEIDSHGDQHYGVIGKATYSYNGTHCGYAALGACNASNSIDQLAVFKRKAVYNTAPVPGLGWEDVYAEILYQGDRSIYCPGSGAQAYHYAVTTEHDDEGTVRVKLAGSWATCPFVSCI